MAQARDPVCGMTIDSEKAAASASFGGETYYFCSTECHRAFEADPARYSAAAARDATSSPADIKTESPHTKTGPIVAPKFGSAGSGGAELEPPTRIDRND
jgi:Cu+-exporting ATPase